MELQILALIFEGLVGAAVSYVGWKLKKIRETEEEMKQREKDFEELELLNTRMILIRECNRYIEKGFAPIYARSSIADIYRKFSNIRFTDEYSYRVGRLYGHEFT